MYILYSSLLRINIINLTNSQKTPSYKKNTKSISYQTQFILILILTQNNFIRYFTE